MSALAEVSKPAAQSTDDLDLVAAVRAGDDRAFELLFARYQSRIAAYVRGMVRDHGRAEDITQEVFIAALRRMRETDREIAFKPWIYEIAKNACIDAFRRTRNTSEVSLDAEDALGPSDHRRLAAPGGAPDEAIATKLSIDNLCGAFGGLSQQHHDILVMREFDGLSYREIGERLGMSRAGVESTLFRARRRLSEEYEEIVSGERCLRVRAIADADGGRVAGLRDRRRLARHISHCQPCRRYAIAAGVDVAAARIPAAASKVAALLPLPAFLRRRLDPEHVLAVHGSPAFNLVTTIDPSTASAWSKAVATAATVAVAGLGAGAAVKHDAVEDFIKRTAPSIVGGAPHAPAAERHQARQQALEQAKSLVQTVRAAPVGVTLDAGAGQHEPTDLGLDTAADERAPDAGQTAAPEMSTPSSPAADSSSAPAAGPADASTAETTGGSSGSVEQPAAADPQGGSQLSEGSTQTDEPATADPSLQPAATVPDGLQPLLNNAGIGSGDAGPALTQLSTTDLTLPNLDGLSNESLSHVLPLDPKPASGATEGSADTSGSGPDSGSSSALSLAPSSPPSSTAGSAAGERDGTGSSAVAGHDGGGAGAGHDVVDGASRGEGTDSAGGAGRTADTAGGARRADGAGAGSGEGAARVHEAVRQRDVVSTAPVMTAGTDAGLPGDAAISRQAAARAREALRRHDVLAAIEATGLSVKYVLHATAVIIVQRPDIAVALRGGPASVRAAREVVVRLIVTRALGTRATGHR
ncbi:MAG: hypothetical protein QOG56_3043 [Solirubrobacteraceae bacterium]|nr:hypothetical protein [Solirubrobacteraceae bacterium]